MDTFNIGDIVQLKSGGPIMTVDGGGNYGIGVVCKWFDMNETLKSDSFAEASLKIYVDQEM
ncbi:YodC family protein [Photobacterium piscicola]|uniref:YodC family protein n=1 Tax=Photobacterium piscicola TaxID=1378299 RepID=UPI002E17F3E7|nr:DUF2158 domain-containing protein [Photobacterium piscicola]